MVNKYKIMIVLYATILQSNLFELGAIETENACARLVRVPPTTCTAAAVMLHCPFNGLDKRTSAFPYTSVMFTA